MDLRTVSARLLALCCAGAFIAAALVYPYQRTWLAPILLAYIVMLCWRRTWWLCALPALLPALDLAPWTGWFFLEEIDLFLLLTAAFAYWHWRPAPDAARLPWFAPWCMGAVSLAYLAAGLKGVLPLAPLDANAFNNYASAYNSLRIGKGWCWALLLLPLLRRDAGPQLENLARLFIPGMLLGLALVSCAALWERLVFPGLMNFSADYRTTAPFSGMHTGGAALDGYLALCLPLVATGLLLRQPRPGGAGPLLALFLLALGAHAGLSTFSRGLFAAFACSIAILAWFVLAPVWRRQSYPGWRRGAAPVAALAAAAAVAILVSVFASSGYRGFAAALVLLAGAVELSGVPVQRALLPASLLCGGAIELALATALIAAGGAGPGILKTPYLLFSLSALLFAGAAWRLPRCAAGRRAGAASLVLIGFFCLAINTLWIAGHWGGPGALLPAALAVALAMLPLAGQVFAGRPLWHMGRAGLQAGAAGAVLLMLAIPICASYYATERFAASASALQGRMRHWTQVAQMMDDGALASALGMGLGTFPATYFWRNPLHEAPARFAYLADAGNRYLRLFPASYNRGYGELLRLLQRVQVRPHTPYRLELDVRRADPATLLHARLCERLLLYPQNCIQAPLRLEPGTSSWRHVQVDIDSGLLGRAPWPWRAPVQLELAAEGGLAGLDIDNVSLNERGTGIQLLLNGNFSKGNNFWFFSSDHHHLPWHVKNLPLYLYFELGWLGLLAISAHLALGMAELAARARAGQPRAAIYLASLAGFLVVGLFDSLLDMPRLALLFYLLLFCSLFKPAPGRTA